MSTMSMKSLTMSKRVIVIGAGAAGLLAGGFAAQNGADVLVLEKNKAPGRKLNITGKGRCNITNFCDTDGLMKNIAKNGRFMYSAFSAFSPQDMIDLLESLGVKTKVERGARVFPESDKAADVTNALCAFLRKNGGRIKQAEAEGLLFSDGCITGVKLRSGEELSCDSVILATGGASYPLTGSTGDGYRMAKECGHTITELSPSLVALVAEPGFCKKAQGVSLKNVTLRAFDGGGKKLFEELGEMLFTHFGVSGPLVLSASAHMRDFAKNEYRISLDLKPGLSEEKLDARLLRDIEEKKNKDIGNLLRGLLPQGMISLILQKSGISPDVKGNSLTREERRKLVLTLKNLEIFVESKRPIEEAIITSGGVLTSEINPKTMESKKLKGLYFAGEIIDVDAYTGGFNLQIAWSSAYAAGTYASEEF